MTETTDQGSQKAGRTNLVIAFAGKLLKFFAAIGIFRKGGMVDTFED